jgi:hypothetical protein
VRDLLFRLCKVRFEELGLRIGRITDSMTVSLGLDLAMRTSVVIRGRDWDGTTPCSVCDAENSWDSCPEAAFFFNSLLGDLTGRAITLFYTPLLIDSDNRKISQRQGVDKYTLEALRGKFDRMTLLCYAMSLLGWDRRVPPEEFADNFDGDTLERLERFVRYEPEVLDDLAGWVGSQYGTGADEAYFRLLSWEDEQQ